ncbi:MAG: hypothetical protein PVH19_04385, partial [Planctomycetia bacterium]
MQNKKMLMNRKIAFLSCSLLLLLGTLACAAGIPERYRSVAPEKIGWKQVRQFPAGLEEPVAIAVDAKGDLYLAGKKSIRKLSPDGELVRTIELKFSPSCLTVDAKGTLFAASKDQVWKVAGEKTVASRPIKDAVLTGIAATEDHLFVADAGNRCVWQLKRPLTDKSEVKPFTKTPFVIPSPYFDLALGPDGLLRIVDPGRHRIKHYTQKGHHETPLDWGRAGFKLDQFPTCCNPAHIGILSDGSVVTVEKKIPRVKVYTLDGKLQSVVVDPKGLIGKRDFDTTAARLVVDVAVGPNDVIYILDPLAKEVRGFEKR